jgi:hypothetical protein
MPESELEIFGGKLNDFSRTCGKEGYLFIPKKKAASGEYCLFHC